MITQPDSVCLMSAYWGPRRQTALNCVTDVLSLIQRIQALRPDLAVASIMLSGGDFVRIESTLSAEDLLAQFQAVEDDYVDEADAFVSLSRDASLKAGMIWQARLANEAETSVLKLICCIGGWSEFLSNSVNIDFPEETVLNAPAMGLGRRVLEAVVEVFDPDVVAFADHGHWREYLDPETLNYAGYLTFLKSRFSPLATFRLKTERLGAGTLITLGHDEPLKSATIRRQTQAVKALRAKANLV